MTTSVEKIEYGCGKKTIRATVTTPNGESFSSTAMLRGNIPEKALSALLAKGVGDEIAKGISLGIIKIISETEFIKTEEPMHANE